MLDVDPTQLVALTDCHVIDIPLPSDMVSRRPQYRQIVWVTTTFRRDYRRRPGGRASVVYEYYVAPFGHGIAYQCESERNLLIIGVPNGRKFEPAGYSRAV
jgi:hypothetical protein